MNKFKLKILHEIQNFIGTAGKVLFCGS